MAQPVVVDFGSWSEVARASLCELRRVLGRCRSGVGYKLVGVVVCFVVVVVARLTLRRAAYVFGAFVKLVNRFIVQNFRPLLAVSVAPIILLHSALRRPRPHTWTHII